MPLDHVALEPELELPELLLLELLLLELLLLELLELPELLELSDTTTVLFPPLLLSDT